jgi:hypothetical protein
LDLANLLGLGEPLVFGDLTVLRRICSIRKNALFDHCKWKLTFSDQRERDIICGHLFAKKIQSSISTVNFYRPARIVKCVNRNAVAVFPFTVTVCQVPFLKPG